MRILSFFFLVLALGMVQWTHAQVLPGSTCQNAIAIQCGAVYATNTLGVLNDNASSGATVCYGVGTGGQIWYSFTATENGMLMLTTCGSAIDTYIHVYTGTCGSLNCMAQNDDGCGLQSSLTISVVAGETYLIRAGGYATVSGSFNLNVSCGESVTGCMDPYASNYNPLANVVLPQKCLFQRQNLAHLEKFSWSKNVVHT